MNTTPTTTTEAEVPEVPTFDALVKTELAKYDAVIPAVEELKNEFMPMKITGIEDKENYDKVSKGLRFIVSKRTAIEEKRKELKADSIAYGKAVDNRAKEITQMITPIEEHLKSEKQRIDNEKDEIERQKELAEQQRIQDRHMRLVEAGMYVVGNQYMWHSPNSLSSGRTESLPSINLETMDDEDFDTFVSGIVALNKAEKDKQEQEKLAREEQERALAQQRKDMEAEQEIMRVAQQKLKDEQDKLLKEQEAAQQKLKDEQDKLQREVEQMRQARTKTRLDLLYGLGLESITQMNAIVYRKKDPSLPVLDSYITIMPYPAVVDMGVEEWNKEYDKIKDLVAKLKEEDDKALADNQAKLERIAEEKAQQKLKDEQKQREDEEKRKKEEDARKKEEADRAEDERLASLSDKDKLAEYCQRLLDVKAPELKTIKWNKELKVITTTIRQFTPEDQKK